MKNKRMKIARIECDMKQEDLAKAVGVTRQTIGLIESGDYNPTLNLCVSICKALGKTLNANQKMYSDFPILEEGNNNITWTLGSGANFTKIKIDYRMAVI